MTKDTKKANRLWLIAAAAVLLFVALAVMPVAAVWNPLASYTNVNISVKDRYYPQYYPADDTYRFTFGGTNAFHITDNPVNTSGFYGTKTSPDGYFYLSDTGGRGYEDEAVLLVAVNSTAPNDFAIHLNVSGYHWNATGATPTGSMVGSYLNPSFDKEYDYTDYVEQPVDTDVVKGWRPAPSANYKIYKGQTDSNQPFRFIFIDLNTSVVGTNAFNASYRSGLVENGTPRVIYNITGTSGDKVAFNVYGWCKSSKDGTPAISWTNQIAGTSTDNGWLVTI